MKNLFVCAVVLSVVPASVHAAPALIVETGKRSETAQISAKIEANRDLGRAWLQIEISDSGPNGEQSLVEVIRRSIDGLSFDQTGNRVVYTQGERVVVCAEGRSVLFHHYLKETGDCPISIRSESRNVDDGSQVFSHTISKVVFDPQA